MRKGTKMTQQSISIHMVVEKILPNYSDDQLVNMLKQRPNKNSILHKAIVEEMAKRSAIEYTKQYGEKENKDKMLENVVQDEFCEIEKAVKKMVSNLTYQRLIDIVIEERIEYYCGNADSDEVNWLLTEYGE